MDKHPNKTADLPQFIIGLSFLTRKNKQESGHFVSIPSGTQSTKDRIGWLPLNMRTEAETLSAADRHSAQEATG
jgi:hypothetical protein